MILELAIGVAAAALLVLVLAVLAALMAAGKADESMELQRLADESAAFVAWIADGIPAEQTRQRLAEGRPKSRLQQRADAMAAQIRSQESEITSACVIADDSVATRQEAR